MVILIILSLGLFCWAQAEKSPMGVKKSQAELILMKEILGTTVNLVTQNAQRDAKRWNSNNITAYYLTDQGAVFMIPTVGALPYHPLINDDIWETSQRMLQSQTAEAIVREENMRRFEESMRQFEKSMRQFEENKLSFEASEAASKTTGKDTLNPSPAPPAPPVPPVPPTPPAPPQINREDLQKSVEKLQAELKKSREEAEEIRKKSLKSLAEIKKHLIEAVANYGDSMTTVRADEYINLVFFPDSFGLLNPGTHYEVLSVQKSWITDYKRGNLSLDDFRQKVLQYSE